MAKKLLLWNLYRPPRDTFQEFKTEIKEILTQIDKTKFNVILGGDFNINLLNINNDNDTAEFFDLMTSYSFYPKITMPTRFSNKKGTLIDNFFCNFSDGDVHKVRVLRDFKNEEAKIVFSDLIL